MPTAEGRPATTSGPAGIGGRGRTGEMAEVAGQTARLLSPSGYDNDAASLRSDQDSDSDDDALQQRARTSRELRAHDRMVFLEEDETDQLVTDAWRQRRGSSKNNRAALANPLKFLGLRRFSDGGGGGSDAPDTPDTPASSLTNATTLRASSSAEGLLAAAGGGGDDDDSADEAAGKGTKSKKKIRRQQRKQRRRDKKARLLMQAVEGEDGELMYEMEEGGLKEGSSTGESSERDDSDELDRRGLLHLADAKGQRRRRTFGRWLLVHALIAAVLAVLAVGAWRMTVAKKKAAAAAAAALSGSLVSNGTALFGPTTLIISLDGFRADFLNRGLTPRLNAFIREGVSPAYMLPSFPSVTFPNHYTLATGLYPESHGVVGNTFWDPALQAEFYYTDPARSLDPKWWGGEPFWVTAERAGARTAVHMWPGSEAHILGQEPSYVDKFDGNEALGNKVARILEFLDQPGPELGAERDVRPRLIAAYVPNVDEDGHRYGPNSTEIRATIAAVDGMLDGVFRGLEARNLTRIVNVVVVSDHGMATTDVTRLLQLEDLVEDMDAVAHVDGWPLVGLRPRNESAEALAALAAAVRRRTADNPNVDVYLRDEDMPARYHFSRNARIAPLWLVPKAGWNIVQRAEFDVAEGVANNLVYHPRGLHGYDHEHPLMRAIFVARGPAFPHAPNSKLEPFQNIEVYNMLCDSIGIEPKPNNGTLRLPLKPVGLHDADGTVEEPADPVPPYTQTATTGGAVPTTAGAASTGAEQPTTPATPATPTTSMSSTTTGAPTAASTAGATGTSSTAGPPPTTTPAADDGDGDGDGGGSKNPLKTWWDWLTDKVDEAWSKLHGGDKQAADERR